MDTSCQCQSGSFGSLGLTWCEIPGQQLRDAVDGVFGDATEHGTKIELWIKAIELGRADERVKGCCSLTAGVGTSKQIVFRPMATQRNALSALLLSISKRPSSR